MEEKNTELFDQFFKHKDEIGKKKLKRTEIIKKIGQDVNEALDKIPTKVIGIDRIKENLDDCRIKSKKKTIKRIQRKKLSKNEVSERRISVKNLFFKNVEVAEIAEILLVSEQTVRNDIKFAMTNAAHSHQDSTDAITDTLNNYEILLQNAMQQYNETDKETDKAAAMNAAIRANESKWKFQMVVGIIEKRTKITGSGLKKAPEKMKIVEIQQMINKVDSDIIRIEKQHLENDKNDLTAEDMSSERMFKDDEEEIQIPENFFDSDMNVNNSLEDLNKIDQELEKLDM